MKLHLPVLLRLSVLSCIAAVAVCTMGSGVAWADNLTFDGTTLIWNTCEDNKSFVDETAAAAAFATGDNVFFSGESNVKLGEDISAGTVVIEKDADVTIVLGGFELDTDLIELGGTLDMGDSLSIGKGGSLEITDAGAVLESNLILGEKGALSVSGAGGSLNGHSLTLQEGASLILTGAIVSREMTDLDQDGELSHIVTPTGDGKTYTLLSGVSELVDKEGKVLAVGSYSLDELFDPSLPGAGFGAGGTLVYAADGNLSLVRHNEIVKSALEITTQQTGIVDYSYYAGVSFKNITSYSDGGAIYVGYNSTITLNNNGSVEFCENTASRHNGGAIHGGDITLSNNGSVVFAMNEAPYTTTSSFGIGGAIYGNKVTLSNNGSVVFEGNKASAHSSIYDGGTGGAIHGEDITLSNNGRVSFNRNTTYGNSADGGAIYGNNITLSGNRSVDFSENRGWSFGGAIYGNKITLNDNYSVEFTRNRSERSSGGAIYGGVSAFRNDSVVFSGNRAWVQGGAIYQAYRLATCTLSQNGRVEFSGNWSDGDGGAIFGNGFISISGNGSVIFRGNTASYGGSGGSIYGNIDSNITLIDNGSITFSENKTTDCGGAIYTQNHLSIRNNESVEFYQNVEVVNGNYRLRSIYADGASNDVISFSAASGKGIIFRDSIYLDGSSLKVNDAYEGKSQHGDIIFTGATTENDLFIVKGNVAGTTEEIRLSRTTEVNTLTNLYGGRLRVEEGAIYQGRGITAMEGSGATVRVQNAMLSHEGYDLTFNSGTALELAGNNTITGNVLQMEGSSLVFDLTQYQGITDHTGSWNVADGTSVCVVFDSSEWTGEWGEIKTIALLKTDADLSVSLFGLSISPLTGNWGHSGLQWEDGTLSIAFKNGFTDVVWTNASGDFCWNNESCNWTDSGFSFARVHGADVTFGKNAAGSVLLDGQMEVGKMTVSADAGYTLDFAEGASLIVQKDLVLENGATLTLRGNLDAAAVEAHGALVVDGRLNVDGKVRAASLQAGALEASSLELTDSTASNYIGNDVEMVGSAAVAGSLAVDGALTAASLQASALEAISLKLTDATASNYIGRDVELIGAVAVAGSLTVEGSLMAGSLQAGALEATSLKLTESNASNYIGSAVEMAGSAEISGSLTVDGVLTAATLQAGALESAGLMLTDSRAANQVSGSVQVNGLVQTAGDLTVGGAMSAQHMSVAGTLTAGSLQTGALDATSLKLTESNASNYIGSTVEMAGSVEVSGSLTVDGVLTAATLQAGALESAGLMLTDSRAASQVSGSVQVNGLVQTAGNLTVGGAMSAQHMSVAGTLTAGSLQTGTLETTSLKLMAPNASNYIGSSVVMTGSAEVSGSLTVDGALTAASLQAAALEVNLLKLTDATARNRIGSAVEMVGGVDVAGILIVEGSLSAASLQAVALEVNSLKLTDATARNLIGSAVEIVGATEVSGSLTVDGALTAASLQAAALEVTSLKLTDGNASNCIGSSVSMSGAADVAGSLTVDGALTAASLQSNALVAASLTLTESAANNRIVGLATLAGAVNVAGTLTVGDLLTAASVQSGTLEVGTVVLTEEYAINTVSGNLTADSVSLVAGSSLTVEGTLNVNDVQMTGSALTLKAGSFGASTMNFVLNRAALESLGLGYRETGTIAQSGTSLTPGFVAILNGGSEAVEAAAYKYTISTDGNSVQLTADYAYDGMQVWYRSDWVGKSSWTDFYIAGYDAVNGVEYLNLNGEAVQGANLYVAYEDGVSSAVVSNGSLQFDYVDMGGGQFEIGTGASVITEELYGKGETLVLHDNAALNAAELTLGTLVLNDSVVAVKKATINVVSGTEGSLTIEAGGSVTVKSDVTLTGLTNEGSLNLGKKNLTVNALVDVGGNVTAQEVRVQSRGSRMAEFNKLVADKVTVVNSLTAGRYTDDLSVGAGSAIGELIAETLEVREGTVTLGRTSGSTEMSLLSLDLQEDAMLVLNQQTTLEVTDTLTATENATVQLKKDAAVSYDGVHISNRKESGTLDVNAYALSGETALELNGAHVAVTGSEDKVIDYKLVNSSVENAGTGTLQVTHAENSLSGVVASSGNVEVYNVTGSMSLEELRIATGLSVSIMVGDEGTSMTPENEADITVVGMAVFEQGATLNANLTLASGSTLVMDGPLHMGSTLELVSGDGSITLSGTMYEALASLEMGESLTLFTGVDSLTLTNDGISVTYRPDELHGVLASDYFGNLPVPGEESYYYITYTSAAVGGGELAIMLNIPEPATATLSLLALAALAARRRRK